MKRIVVGLLSIFISVSAAAENNRNSVGVNYGLDLDGVVGIQADLDISAALSNKAPVALQLFWKNYSQSYLTGAGTYQYSYNGFGAAALYDFGAVFKQNKKISPYAGLGLITLNAQLSGPNAPFNRAADSGGLYFVVGAKYGLTPQLSADLDYNNFGGLTLGAILAF